MQRVIRRSDARSVTPSANDDDRASNEVLRFVFEGAHDDDDSDEDLYETLMSKGLVDKVGKNNGAAKSRSTAEDDSWTASCTESYSSSWSASMHDSFGPEAASHPPQQYQPSPQPYASPMSHHSVAVSGSPRRRRRRRGSLDRTAMLPVAAPPLTEGKPPLTAREGAGADPPPLVPKTTASAAAAAHSRARPPRRKHGSFLESSSTSCCLNDIVEETENTESSAAAPNDFHGDAADDLGSSMVERHNSSGLQQWSGRRVRFGHVEIRSYGVTLDQVGGYGLEGKPVSCPLTLDWRYDGTGTVRKPAILLGYTSYFRQVKLRPTTVDERRARLGVLHHMRQPQVKRWEYRALLYQMAALQSKDYLPDRWQERSNCDDFDGRAVPDDRVPSEPTRRTAHIDALANSLRQSSIEVPSERGVDLPIVPMQWIDHDSRPESVRRDSWTPLEAVWLNVHATDKKASTSDRATVDESHVHARECTRHCMPTMPSLWLQDPQRLIAHEDSSKDVDDPDFAPLDDFQVIPFEPIVTSKVREKPSVGCSPPSARTKEWKRSPPGRSNVKKIVVPCDIPSENSTALPMPRAPFQWITGKSEECRTQDFSAVGGESAPDPDAKVPSASPTSEFRKVSVRGVGDGSLLEQTKSQPNSST
jgi:hypothetical protein